VLIQFVHGGIIVQGRRLLRCSVPRPQEGTVQLELKKLREYRVQQGHGVKGEELPPELVLPLQGEPVLREAPLNWGVCVGRGFCVLVEMQCHNPVRFQMGGTAPQPAA